MPLNRRTALGLALLCLTLAPRWAGASANPSATSRAAEWILSQQNPDGGLFEATYPPDGQAEAAASLVSAGVNDERLHRLLSSIERTGQTRTSDAGWTARIVSGLVAGQRDPRSSGGYDYVAKLKGFYDPASGAYDERIYADALAIIGLVAAREPVPPRAIDYLRSNQCPSGGFFHDPGCPGVADVDTTSMVISAMIAAGVSRDDLAVKRARTFLLGSRNTEGGFGLSPQGTTNANSTSLALSAIAALAEKPELEPWASSDGKSPIKALLALQVPSGGFRYRADSPDANRYATIQAIPGAAGHSYPIPPAPTDRTARPKVQAGPGSDGPSSPASRNAQLPEGAPSPLDPTEASLSTLPEPLSSSARIPPERPEDSGQRPAAIASTLVFVSATMTALKVGRKVRERRR